MRRRGRKGQSHRFVPKRHPGTGTLGPGRSPVRLCYRCRLPLGERGMMLYAEDDDPEGEPTLPYCGLCRPHTILRSLEDA